MKLKLLSALIALAMITVGCAKDKTISEGGTGGDGGYKGDHPKDALIDHALFDLLDLNAQGMEKVKASYEEGEWYEAAENLLSYYRLRRNVMHPDVSLVNNTITTAIQKSADDGLKYFFRSATGYEPVCYLIDGKIDWRYWPVQDNEIRWQLHRHYWFSDYAKVYRATQDEEYILAWIAQYSDWLEQNPMIEDRNSVSAEEWTNFGFAWRALEVSERIENQCEIFLYFINSKSFTPEWLIKFLTHFNEHVEYVGNNYTATGNHRIMEGQRVCYAGCIFPEFKRAEDWVRSGSAVLAQEIDTQVLPDGMQYELDFGYHIGAIADFYGAMRMARANNKEALFDAGYISQLRKMTEVVKNITFPDYSVPQFADVRKNSWTRSVLTRNFRNYYSLFPDDNQFLWLATSGASGAQPNHTNKYFKDSGFYVLRNGWSSTSTMMVYTNGPDGPGSAFHNQPDNGTFELWVAGRNFFPDAGVFKYSGDALTNAQRNYFRQTSMHNTMTRDYANIATMAGKCLHEETVDNTDVLVTENQSYGNVRHRRTIFFVNKAFFVLVDEAIGSGGGALNLNFHLLEGGNVVLDLPNNVAYTNFTSGANLYVKTVGSPNPLTSEKYTGSMTAPAGITQGGNISYVIDEIIDRSDNCYSVNQTKDANVVARYMTVLLPVSGNSAATQNVTASFNGAYSATAINVNVTVNGTAYNLQTTIP